jgi:hypothetical protein
MHQICHQDEVQTPPRMAATLRDLAGDSRPVTAAAVVVEATQAHLLLTTTFMDVLPSVRLPLRSHLLHLLYWRREGQIMHLVEVAILMIISMVYLACMGGVLDGRKALATM